MKRILFFFGLILGAAALTSIAQYLSPSTAVAAAEPANDVNISSDCTLSTGYPQEIRQWCDLITIYAGKNNLDPNLLAALIWQESGGNPQALSVDGAVGLMQVMPRDGLAARFQCINGPCFAGRPSMNELYDPEFNIAWGSAYLNSLQQSKGSLREALKAYGPANSGYSYADKVLSIYTGT